MHSKSKRKSAHHHRGEGGATEVIVWERKGLPHSERERLSSEDSVEVKKKLGARRAEEKKLSHAFARWQAVTRACEADLQQFVRLRCRA